jgi:hypothetical protein
VNMVRLLDWLKSLQNVLQLACFGLNELRIRFADMLGPTLDRSHTHAYQCTPKSGFATAQRARRIS